MDGNNGGQQPENIMDHVETLGGVTGGGPDDSDSDGGCGSALAGRLLIAAVVVLTLLAAYMYLSPSGRARILAGRLAREGWFVYYLHGCGHCAAQDKLLRGKFRNVVVCGRDGSAEDDPPGSVAPPLTCGSSAIRGYPFWANARTHKTRAGVQPLEALKKMACSGPAS